MKVSSKENVVLRLLAIQPGQYGLELVRRSQGVLNRNSIYATLGRMKSKGLVQSWEEIKPEYEYRAARNMYSTTIIGRRALLERDE